MFVRSEDRHGEGRQRTLSLSESTTRFVRKDAPTVLVVLAGENAFFTYRWTREVLPTPWEPRTTIFASRDCAIVKVWLCFEVMAGVVWSVEHEETWWDTGNAFLRVKW